MWLWTVLGRGFDRLLLGAGGGLVWVLFLVFTLGRRREATPRTRRSVGLTAILLIFFLLALLALRFHL